MTPQIRRVLMWTIPLLAALAIGLAWTYSGRHVATDNAYIKATQIHLSPEVSGLIHKVWVRENQQVRAGDALLTLNQAPVATAVVAPAEQGPR